MSPMFTTAHIDVSRYMPIPFKERGRDYDGADCYGLYYLFARDEKGVQVPSYAEAYATCMDKEEISAIIRQETASTWEPIEQSEVQAGDLVVLRIAGHPWHCGVMLDRHKFLHIEIGANVCRDDVTSVRWAKRVDGFYRWKQ